MSPRRVFGLAFLAALTACKGSCSCGSSGDDDDGSGGSGASTSTPTSSNASSGSTTSGGGDGGAGVTSTGGAGQGGTGTGASSQGGSGQGGSGQGGSGQGGTGQGGGEGGSGQGGGERIAERECRVAEDCQLVDDCCTCDAIPAGEEPAECLAQCVQSSCSAQLRGDDAVVSCIAGRCVAGFECDWNATTCDAAPPNCEDGFTASVIDGCYGPCVLATECNSVGSCDQCDGGLGCVEQLGFGTTSHCVTDAPCAVDDCNCLGPSVCADDTEICIEDDDDDVVVCECLTC